MGDKCCYCKIVILAARCAGRMKDVKRLGAWVLDGQITRIPIVFEASAIQARDAGAGEIKPRFVQAEGQPHGRQESVVASIHQVGDFPIGP